MIKSTRLLSSIAAVLALSLTTPAQSPGSSTTPTRIALRAARMLDGKSPNYVSDAVVLIDGRRITAAGGGLLIPAGYDVINLGDATILPGLIDSHTHLLLSFDGSLGFDDVNMLLTIAQMSTAKRALLGAAMGKEALEAGITTVRDLGNSGWNGDVALRDAINSGWLPGPRMIVSTRALAAAGGQLGQLAPPAQRLIEQEYIVISGVEEARKAVRQAIYDGADCIKVIIDTEGRALSVEEVRTIVEEAHRVGLKVAAHAISEEATRIAAQAGADSIEHAYQIPDDVLAMMAERRIFLVPTDFPLDGYVATISRGSAEERKQLRNFLVKFVAGNRDRLARAVKAGVLIAAGSDFYYAWPGRTRGQASLSIFRAYADAGMTPWQIIQAATANAAECLGRQSQIGSIAKGKFADIIAVEGDPLKDVTELERVTFVMKAGRVIKNPK